MKNKAKHRIRYYDLISNPVFSENFTQNDYLCRGVFKKTAGSVESEAFSAVGRKAFYALITGPKKATDK